MNRGFHFFFKSLINQQPLNLHNYYKMSTTIDDSTETKNGEPITKKRRKTGWDAPIIPSTQQPVTTTAEGINDSSSSLLQQQAIQKETFEKAQLLLAQQALAETISAGLLPGLHTPNTLLTPQLQQVYPSRVECRIYVG